MTKAELIATISDATELHGNAVERVLDELALQASKRLSEGDPLTLPGIGKLERYERAARKGRNPATGQMMDIPAKGAVKFKATKALAEYVA